MQTFSCVDEVEAQIRGRSLIGLQRIGAAVGVENYNKLRKPELIEALVKIARGELQPLPISRRVSAPSRMFIGGDVALAILQFNEKFCPNSDEDATHRFFQSEAVKVLGNSLWCNRGHCIDEVLNCAKEEFLEKGYEGASFHSIAKRAGCTAGMLYGRFADKRQIFREIVNEAAENLVTFYFATQEMFSGFKTEKPKSEMNSFAAIKAEVMMDIIYHFFDEFKLILTKSAGSGYEYYIDNIIGIETKSAELYIKVLHEAGYSTKEIRSDVWHMLIGTLVKGVFNVVTHDFPKEEAIVYVKQLQVFFNAGWHSLLGVI